LAPVLSISLVSQHAEAQNYAFNVIATFDDFNGFGPIGNVAMDGEGDVFGVTSGDGGSIYELSPGSDSPTTLYEFMGEVPESLTLDGEGNLIGTTHQGGQFEVGTVYKFPIGGNSVTEYSFDESNGSNPSGRLISAGNGVYFGDTGLGFGNIYEYNENNNSIDSVVSLNGTNMQGTSGLCRDANGNLFGTALRGGTNHDGTVFELPSGETSINTLVNSDGTNGASPSGLIVDSKGNLYGTTSGGGAEEDGTIFELPAGCTTLKTLASFDNANGASPGGNLNDCA